MPSINPPYQYANNPSRLNPRMPNSKKGDGNDENDFNSFFEGDAQKSASLSMLNEHGLAESSLSSGLMMNSLMSDAGRSGGAYPLDLMPGGFQSAPSGVFGNHLIGSDAQFPQGLSVSDMTTINGASSNDSGHSHGLSPMSQTAANKSNPQMPALISNNAVADDSMDQATKQFQHLYVSSVSPLHSTQKNIIARSHRFFECILGVIPSGRPRCESSDGSTSSLTVSHSFAYCFSYAGY